MIARMGRYNVAVKFILVVTVLEDLEESDL